MVCSTTSRQNKFMRLEKHVKLRKAHEEEKCWTKENDEIWTHESDPPDFTHAYIITLLKNDCISVQIKPMIDLRF